jgi:hypothetical protein
MTEVEAERFVTRFAQAWASRVNADFEVLWDPEGNLIYPFVGRVIKGREIGVLNEVTKQNAPELTWRLLGWTLRGETIVVEWESSNRYGEHMLVWRGVDKLTVRNGRIVEEVVYTDTAPLHGLRRGQRLEPLMAFPDPAQ